MRGKSALEKNWIILKKISHKKIKNLSQSYIFESVHADVAHIG